MRNAAYEVKKCKFRTWSDPWSDPWSDHQTNMATQQKRPHKGYGDDVSTCFPANAPEDSEFSAKSTNTRHEGANLDRKLIALNGRFKHVRCFVLRFVPF